MLGNSSFRGKSPSPHMWNPNSTPSSSHMPLTPRSPRPDFDLTSTSSSPRLHPPSLPSPLPTVNVAMPKWAMNNPEGQEKQQNCEDPSPHRRDLPSIPARGQTHAATAKAGFASPFGAGSPNRRCSSLVDDWRGGSPIV